MTKHIGIVSVNYEGTALCYRSICEEAASVMGEYRHPQITIHSFPLADYMRFVSRGDWEGVAGLLLESAKKVASAGADFAICPANTTHEAFRFMRSRSPIPWLHIAEVVGDAAASRALSRLGILGTKFLMEGNLYDEVLSERGIEAVRPDQNEREKINTLIFDELVKGILHNSTREFFRGVTSHLASNGCDAVVLGCTEIPLIIDGDYPLPWDEVMAVVNIGKVLEMKNIEFAMGPGSLPTQNSAPAPWGMRWLAQSSSRTPTPERRC